MLALLALPAAAEDAPVMPPAGATPLLEVAADGVQIYDCQADGSWKFRAPEALLFDATGRQVGTHGAGPQWRMADGSVAAGAVAANAPASRAGAIPWLLLRATPEAAPGLLARAAWVRRFDTVGGTAPPGPCQPGEIARMRYSARYGFYGQ